MNKEVINNQKAMSLEKKSSIINPKKNPAKGRTVNDKWYTSLHLEDLGQTWQSEEIANKEKRYFIPFKKKEEVKEKKEVAHDYWPELTSEVLKNLPKDKPAKFMLYANTGGNHWVGIGVIVKDKKATISYADSFPSNKNKGQIQPFINDITKKFTSALGANTVTTEPYKHTWIQTDWRGNKEESPNSCGAYTIENTRRFLENSVAANIEQNPGSLIVRERQLARMTTPTAITGASYNNVLMDEVIKFSKENQNIGQLNENNARKLLNNTQVKLAVMSERNIKEGEDLKKDDFLGTLNIYLAQARKKIEKEKTLIENLNKLKNKIGDKNFKTFIERGCKITEDLAQNQEIGIESATVTSVLPFFTPEECDKIIQKNFKDITPPFEMIAQKKELSRLKLQEQEAKDYEMAKELQQKQFLNDMLDTQEEITKQITQLKKQGSKQNLDKILDLDRLNRQVHESTKAFIKSPIDRMTYNDLKKVHKDILEANKKLKNIVKGEQKFLSNLFEKPEVKRDPKRRLSVSNLPQKPKSQSKIQKGNSKFI